MLYLFLFQVIKMLVAIIVLFAICHGPSLIDSVLVSFGYVEQLNYGHLKYMRQAFALMSYFNSCTNPIVYAFMSKTFRESFKYALCVCSNHGEFYRKARFTGYKTTHSQANNVSMATYKNHQRSRPSPYPSPTTEVKATLSNHMLITDPVLSKSQKKKGYGTPHGHFV